MDISDLRIALFSGNYNMTVDGANKALNRLVGYLLSGDPAYVTSHNDARSKIRTLERDELLEELVRSYLEKGNKK